MSLGGRVKKRRKELGWSQEDLASRSGVGQGTISKMERTDQQTSTYSVKLATALGVSPQWLETGSNQKAGTTEELKNEYHLNDKMLKRVLAIENASEEFQAGLDRMLGIDD